MKYVSNKINSVSTNMGNGQIISKARAQGHRASRAYFYNRIKCDMYKTLITIL
jgi:hypothetical protein